MLQTLQAPMAVLCMGWHEAMDPSLYYRPPPLPAQDSSDEHWQCSIIATSCRKKRSWQEVFFGGGNFFLEALHQMTSIISTEV
jgi:hypothetical protein